MSDFSKLKTAMQGKKSKPKVQYVPQNRLDVSPTADQTAAEPGVEGYDSEGKKKKSLYRP